MADTFMQPALQQLGRPLSLVAVGLEEAAIDSPTFRASAIHFSDQVEIIERWLDGYIKSISKLTHDASALEETFNTFLLRSVPPANISEAVLDHDYTLLAMRRFGEGSRELWSQIIYGMKKMDANVVDPIKSFMSGELRNFKDARRYLEQSQKNFDNTLARYVSQSKTKEPSALREDAFQVHEMRKLYQKASLDFCLLAPQLRYTMDKLLVKVLSDQWRDMRKARELGGINFAKWGGDMDRVRGWSKEMEASEAVFRRELQIARRDIAEEVSNSTKPSRELEDYNLSTVSHLGSKGPSTLNLNAPGKKKELSEKQGWLFNRQISGKPARTVWHRRWFYVKNGIFGWLQHGERTGGVEESEKIGVLLCNVKPAVQEERRFCFEVKTKNQTILLQAETQVQLMEWLEAFEVAKNKALSASANNDYSHPGGIDPAFAITPPSVPEFAAKAADGHVSHGSEEISGSAFERIGTLPVPGGPEITGLASRGSFDVTAPRRAATTREEIMNKLDLHRKSTTQLVEPPASPGPTLSSGIASLISASHNILPVYAPPMPSSRVVLPQVPEFQGSTLAPSTLANPPAPTNLSKSAVIVSGERGLSIRRGDDASNMPNGIMANLWGTNNRGYINRLEKVDVSVSPGTSPALRPQDSSPSTSGDENRKLGDGSVSRNRSAEAITASSGPTHKKAASVDVGLSQHVPKPETFPSGWPLELKTQQAQFRILFPSVPLEDKLLLVFRATWNPNDQQDFPGRVYVTQNDVYFYSHHLGLILIYSVALDSITEVTAAPGKDCDFIFLHLREGISNAGYTRITIKVFLEPLRLLQSRLNFLIDICQADEPLGLDAVMATLLKMESEKPTRSPSVESWEDIPSNTPIDDGTESGRATKPDLRSVIHVERNVNLGAGGKEVAKFQLPSKPVIYEPTDMQRKVVERQFQISPKALFHVMFGDKSAVFQLLYHERRAKHIAQGPWIPQANNHMRRDFNFDVQYSDVFRRARPGAVVDYQVIELMNDHVCYVVADFKTPWHLPHHNDFMLVSKIVITHVAKSKCKLAVFTKVDWSRVPRLSKGLVERQAFDDASLDAEELAEVVADQVRRLGKNSRTQKAIHIFGQIGQQTTTSVFSAKATNQSKRPQIKQRTLTHMVMETVSSFAESVISSVMLWIFAIIRGIWKVSSAHSIILVALLVSGFANVFFTSRDTSVWWAERRAARFMSRIGVGPNSIMSKAIYLKDLDDALRAVPVELSDGSRSKCYDHFREITNVTDLDVAYQTAGATFSETSTRSTAKRLRRTRQHLGLYRHDLVVAMRVINNVEQEVLRAEWENWLLDENSRCKQVDALLREDRKSTSPVWKGKGAESQKIMKTKEEERMAKMAELRQWRDEYCGSCKMEQQKLEEERKHLSFA